MRYYCQRDHLPLCLIYQMHSQMKATNDKIMEIDSKISASKHELEQQQSPKRLKAEAAKRGYVPANFFKDDPYFPRRKPLCKNKSLVAIHP